MRPDPVTDESPAVAGPLNRRFAVSFVVAAALLLANQLLVQPPLLRLANDAPVINVAGRQRMLSQRLAKAALALAAAEAAGERTKRRAELAETLALWSTSHELLRQGDPSLSLPGDNPPAVREAFDDIDPYFRRLRTAAAGLIAAPDSRSARELAVILADEGEFLARMDRIVSLYEADARERAARLRRTGWVVTGLILLALLAIGRFVLAPASRVIEAQVADLRDARQRLEERVRERTAELEASHVELETEHAERLAAEERHRRLLEQFGHAARVNTMGEMASSLAHELNQPLGAIANYVGGCIERLDGRTVDHAELRGAMERAQSATLRAGEIVRRIRRFVTRHEFRGESLAPARVVEETVALLRDEADRRGVTVETEVASDLPSVKGDAVQLQQVLVNLIRNSFDAVDAMRASDAAKPVRPNVIVAVGRSSAGGVSFSVIDNGEGMPAERVGQMFDPFFSTRAEGMGMGLAISRGIAEAHGGKIETESEPGVGTRVTLTLPGEEKT